MGSSKKHKKESSSKKRSRSRSEDRSDKRKTKTRHQREPTRRTRRSAERERSVHSDSEYEVKYLMINLKIFIISGSDVVEVIAPEPPVISKPVRQSPSPTPEGGAGDVLSIDETNKLRAKLGLKPLEVGPIVTFSKNDDNEERDESTIDLKRVKDDWGEFYHKPAGQFNEKSEVELLREKIQAKRDKRKIEQRLARIKTLGESDTDDDPQKWVEKSRKVVQEEKQKAKRRARIINEMDADLDVSSHKSKRKEGKSRSYKEKDLKGLKVGHDIESFTEDRHVILTLKDQDVLEEDGDTLINVNMIENERYKKNVEVRKQNPLSYGYDVYEECYDEFGNYIERSVLGKYDDVDGTKVTSFTLGESRGLILEQQRKAMEIKAKLQNKTLESLNMEPLKLASDLYTHEELTKFKKPKKKVKKMRQKFKADDLLDIVGESSNISKDFGRRRRDQIEEPVEDDIKIEAEDEDLEQNLRKARRLRQKGNLIKKEIQLEEMQVEVKEEEPTSDGEGQGEGEGFRERENGLITLNQTAEFCRTLGDIPTYGMAGNRDDNPDLMDIEENDAEQNEEDNQGKWNSVALNEDNQACEIETNLDFEDVAILDEEPDVASGVAAALQLAMSKGYIEKEENNRPSNSRFAHLQAQHYSIDDKTHGEDDKYARRNNNSDRFNGPTTEFREKPSYKPNVKLEYIDDNNQKLTPKEAFRYLSHKFHGKGPGKNKIEKRLKKLEQEAVSVGCATMCLNLFNVFIFFILAHEERLIVRHSIEYTANAEAETKRNPNSLCRIEWQKVSANWKEQKINEKLHIIDFFFELFY